MKRLALLLILTFNFSLVAHADEASRRDKAKEMLVLMHTDRLLKQMMDGIMKQTTAMTHQMIGDKVTTAQQARLDDFQKKIFALVQSQLNYESLEPDYIKLYADNFTDEELDGILVFYKSPAGHSMIDKMPALTTQALALSQSRMTILIPQITQMVQQFAKDCAECKAQQPVPSPNPGS